LNLNVIVIHLFNTKLNPYETAKYACLLRSNPSFKDFSPSLIKENCKTPSHFTGRRIRYFQIFTSDYTLLCIFLHEDHLYPKVFLEWESTQKMRPITQNPEWTVSTVFSAPSIWLSYLVPTV